MQEITLNLWLLSYGYAKVNPALSDWFWPLLGLIFMSWTILLYVLIFPVVGFDWLWMGLAFLADLGTYSGGAYDNRKRIPGYG